MAKQLNAIVTKMWQLGHSATQSQMGCILGMLELHNAATP
jgi:hypothetical protein